ncbi:hypothetical protein BGW80DRAFT_154274 [Lactifluus volemus]|nr:hypothetical protein BGW80DRAFT_154274 [Lactifluus volemus]
MSLLLKTLFPSLVALFDQSWKVSEVKQYILTKVYTKSVTTQDFRLSDDRPVSPITFASAFRYSQHSFDSTDGLLELEEDSITDSDSHSIDPFRQRRARQQPTSRATPLDVPSSSSSPTLTHPIPTTLPPYHYPILAFSTGQLLEDDFSLSWYHLRPHELLELHPPGTIVPLQRETMLDYIQPYLEFDVRALRVVVNEKDSSQLGHAHNAHGLELYPNKIWKATAESRATATCGGNCCSSTQQSGRKRRKTKLEWRDRYLVIRQGPYSRTHMFALDAHDPAR